MNVTCPRCPTTWRHRESTGHCAACHHTFIGLEAFDRHQTINDDGGLTCHNPETATRLDGSSLYERYTPIPAGWNGDFWRKKPTDAQRVSHERFVEKVRVDRV